MLYLLFSLGETQVALDVRQVVEVVPLVDLAPVSGAPDYVAGVLDYRGTVIPVVDLCSLASGRPCSERMSTRIIVVRRLDDDGVEQLFGLLAERVTEAVEAERRHLEASRVLLEATLDLGEVATGDGEMLQCLDLERIIPEGIEALDRAAGSDEGASATD